MRGSLPAAVLLLMIQSPSPSAAGGPNDAAASPAARTGRNPFMPVVAVSAEARVAGPLGRTALAQLRLVATVNGIEPARALIEDPAGLGFITRPGTVIGSEQYTIVTIGRGEIVLERKERSATETAVRVVMKLTTAEAEAPR